MRGIVIITRVDHDKTTLVDQLLRQSGVFCTDQGVVDRIMDSNDIEREHSIMILSRNTVVNYDGVKINIIDTPGHTDFGGKVERVLKMVNDVILMVGASENTMPQTRFVLKKAPELSLDAVFCVSKCDRPEARPDEVMDEVLELFVDLNTTDQQLECPSVFASVCGGQARTSIDSDNADTKPLFETTINHIPMPEDDSEVPTQVLISTTDYNKYIDRISMDKMNNGSTHVSQEVAIVNRRESDKLRRVKIDKLYEYEGLSHVEMKEAEPGSIVAAPDTSDLHIGDTITSLESPESILFQRIPGPTISMNFMVNDSPLADQEDQYITSRHLRNRLSRELNTDVSLRVGELMPDHFKVGDHDELHPSVLIENVRCESFEFTASKTEIVYHCDERDKRQEPMETAFVDVPDGFTGAVIQKLTSRKGEPTGIAPVHGSFMHLEFNIPSRSLTGHCDEFLTDTKSNGILNTEFKGYGPHKGDMFYRKTGSIITYKSDEAIAYGLFQAQERGQLFIGVGIKAYAGMIIGQSGKSKDVEVNVYKTKKLTNTRTPSSGDALKLITPKVMSLEQCLEFIGTDEFLEVTPENLRIRKKILNPALRKRAMIEQKQNS